MKSWIEQLLPIIEEYKDGDTSPLDGDAVDALCNIIKAKINLQEGNITLEEYECELDKSIIPSGNFKNNQLNFDLEKIKNYDSIDISKSFEASFDYPNCLDVNGETYFYAEESDRDFDWRLLHEVLNKPIYKVKNLETNEIEEWPLEAILEEINRDRSGGWTDYTESDWVEGWLEWVDGEYYELLFPCKISIHDGGSDYDWEHFLKYTDAYTRFVQLQGNGNDIHLYELDSNNEYEVKNSSK